MIWKSPCGVVLLVVQERCLKLEDQEEDIQVLVAPDRESVTSGTESRDKGNKTSSPVAGRTRAQQHPVIQAPLRQAVGPDITYWCM